MVIVRTESHDVYETRDDDDEQAGAVDDVQAVDLSIQGGMSASLGIGDGSVAHE